MFFVLSGNLVFSCYFFYFIFFINFIIFFLLTFQHPMPKNLELFESAS